MKDQIKILVKAAANAVSPDAALSFSQAAVNVACAIEKQREIEMKYGKGLAKKG